VHSQSPQPQKAAGTTGESLNKTLIISLLLFLCCVNVAAAAELPYWIQETDYVYVPVNISGNSNLTLYIEKTPGYSPDGDTVFEFFDDFSGNQLSADWNRWLTGGSHSVNDGTLTLSAAGSWESVGTVQKFTYPSIFEYRLRAGSETNSFSVGLDKRTTGGSSFEGITSGYANGRQWTVTRSGNTQTTPRTNVITSDSNIKIVWRSGAVDFFHNGAYDKTIANTPLEPCGVSLGTSSPTLYVDYVLVRQYTELDPSITVIDMGTYYKIEIQNNEATALTEYQIQIPASELNVVSSTESLYVSDVPPYPEV